MAENRAPKILVVDDEMKNVKLLEAQLTPRGYTVFTASDGLAVGLSNDTTTGQVIADVVRVTEQ